MPNGEGVPLLFPFQAMGTACSFHVFAGSEKIAEAAVLAAAREIYRLEGKYSRYDPESELSAINRLASAGGSVTLDDETADIIDEAFRWHAESGGLFDITSGVLRRIWNFGIGRVPNAGEMDETLRLCGLHKLRWQRPLLSFGIPGMEIDFGGIVKEYAADRAAEILIRHGATGVLVELGGDIRVIGERPDGEAWRVGIRKPGAKDSVLAAASLTSGGLATSGDYERFYEIDGRRYGHILNPLTGWPVEGSQSISVVAPTCLEAGRASTLATLIGAEGRDWLDAHAVDYLIVDAAGKLHGSGTALEIFRAGD